MTIKEIAGLILGGGLVYGSTVWSQKSRRALYGTPPCNQRKPKATDQPK